MSKVTAIHATPELLRRLKRLKDIMIRKDLKPHGFECGKHIPAYHHIVLHGVRMIEKELGLSYEDSDEFKEEQVRRIQKEKSELEEYNYLNPEETQKLLEERGLSHFIRGIPFKFESEEQNNSEA